ncbi:hypothetical protein BKA69DRAFT_1029718 [Paraphysoderma sedebokerense]|nr:hypothetical protein BKA69DRAFT_1029718 [Paraphysoderma sedebokerense]
MLLDQYNRTIFICGICLSERKGSSCFQFCSCSHVFCTQCLTDFFEMLIKEGLVRSVKCPHPSCTSENARLSSRELETLLPEAVMERYNFLYTQQSYELDPQITWCVLPHCRGPAKKSADCSKGAYEKLATCLKCGYNFCHWCSKTWHGTQTFCEVKNGDKVVTDYLNGDDNIKRRIEVQYGKSIVAKMVQKYREEEATKAFLKSTATPCPSCSTYITKTEGCNHMTCQSCQTHFCYRCGSYLPSSNPYSHYNFGGSSCYGQLFDSLHTDDDALFEFAFV